MSTARSNHASVYHRGFVYIVGGYNRSSKMVKCERLCVSEDRWEALPPLPEAVDDCGVVTQESTQSLYVIGGRECDSILELRLDLLSWRRLAVKLASLRV